jgi:hypothetical protein
MTVSWGLDNDCDDASDCVLHIARCADDVTNNVAAAARHNASDLPRHERQRRTVPHTDASDAAHPHDRALGGTVAEQSSGQQGSRILVHRYEG